MGTASVRRHSSIGVSLDIAIGADGEIGVDGEISTIIDKSVLIESTAMRGRMRTRMEEEGDGMRNVEEEMKWSRIFQE